MVDDACSTMMFILILLISSRAFIDSKISENNRKRSLIQEGYNIIRDDILILKKKKQITNIYNDVRN